jgi:hypothetical protein
LRREATESLRELHTEEQNNLYFSPGNVRDSKLRRMKWVEHVAHEREKKCIQN